MQRFKTNKKLNMTYIITANNKLYYTVDTRMLFGYIPKPPRVAQHNFRAVEIQVAFVHPAVTKRNKHKQRVKGGGAIGSPMRQK